MSLTVVILVLVLVLVMSVAFFMLGCSPTANSYSVGIVVDYWFPGVGTTVIETATYRVEIAGTHPIKLGSRAEIKDYDNLGGPKFSTLTFPDFGKVYMVESVSVLAPKEGI